MQPEDWRRLLESSRKDLAQSEEKRIQHGRNAAEKKVYLVLTSMGEVHNYLQLTAERQGAAMGECMEEVLPFVEAKNQKIARQIRGGGLQIESRNRAIEQSRMGDSRVESISASKVHVPDHEQELRKSLAIKQLIKKKQGQKAERQRRLEQVLSKELQTQKVKDTGKKKEEEHLIWQKNQKSLQRYRQTKSKHHQDIHSNRSKLQIIKEFQEGLFSIAKHKNFSALDSDTKRQLETSRTEAIMQRRSELRIDYDEIKQHNRRYIQDKRSVEEERGERMSKRRSEDIHAMKSIKPFHEFYEDNTVQEVRDRVAKMKEFKQYVRKSKKPKIDVNKRQEIIDSIVKEDANKYKSQGIIKQEINGVIVEKQLPKINLRALGNEYLKVARKMKSTKSSLDNRATSPPPQPQTQPKNSLINYLDHLKKEERKRMSKSQEISKSKLSLKEKVKMVQISIECLENEILKHQTLIRNSFGLTSDKVQELRDAVDGKSEEIINLNLILANLIEEAR